MSLFAELKRRNVFRVGIAYAVTSWLLLQVVDVVVPVLELPEWVPKLILLLLAVGILPALIFAWAFELTPEGLKREREVDRTRSITSQTGRKLDFAIIAVLTVALAWFAWDRFGPGTPADGTPAVAETVAPAPLLPAGKSVAVLPFVAMSSGPDDEYFADGLTEEILNSLAQLPELLVTARTSSFHFKGRDVPVQEIAQALNVGHIVEGSIRNTGERLRVTAQLVRAADGFHLWSENYDSTSQDTIAVQEDIAEKIALAMDVVLDEQKREAMRKTGIRDVEAFVAFQKGQDFYERGHGQMNQLEALREANRHFETALARVPGIGAAYTLHSDLFVHIVNNDASGIRQPGISAEMVASAYENAISDLNAAARHAPDPATRASAELDLAIFTGQWSGLAGRVQRVIGLRTCQSSAWINAVGTVYGFGEPYLDYLRYLRACDPLQQNAWINEARAELWNGNPQAGAALAREGLEIAENAWLTTVLVRTLLGTGDLDEAQRVASARFQDAESRDISSIMVAAARGDRARAGELFQAYLAQDYASGFYRLLVNAWIGNREAVNELASQVDAHEIGPFSLLLHVYWCLCGAPWDLESTPGFAGRLAESGLAWPPPTPVRFPLKDW